jgi:hypothetical protein
MDIAIGRLPLPSPPTRPIILALSVLSLPRFTNHDSGSPQVDSDRLVTLCHAEIADRIFPYLVRINTAVGSTPFEKKSCPQRFLTITLKFPELSADSAATTAAHPHPVTNKIHLIRNARPMLIWTGH